MAEADSQKTEQAEKERPRGGHCTLPPPHCLLGNRQTSPHQVPEGHNPQNLAGKLPEILLFKKILTYLSEEIGG